MPATTLDFLAEQLHRLLSGGDVPRDSPWDRRELLLLVTQANARVIQASYWDNLKADGEHSVDGLLTVALDGLPLTEDTARKEWVATLPRAYISLPAGRGLQRVRYAGKPGLFDLVSAPKGLLMGSRVLAALPNDTYEVVGLQVRVAARCPLKAPVALDVRVVMTGGAMPAEMEMATLAEALKLVAARQKPDLTNDDNPTP